jgi:hypothetical protein
MLKWSSSEINLEQTYKTMKENAQYYPNWKASVIASLCQYHSQPQTTGTGINLHLYYTGIHPQIQTFLCCSVADEQLCFSRQCKPINLTLASSLRTHA